MPGMIRRASTETRQCAARALLLPVVLLAACATPVSPPPATPGEVAAPPSAAPAISSAQVQGLRDLVAQQDRLYRVAAPLLVKNAELCKNHARNLLGFTAKNKYSYSADLVPAAQQALGLDERLQVMGVLTGSGAARAGVQRGDVLVAVEENPLPAGANAERQAATILAPLMTGRANVKLSVMRNAGSMSLNVPLTYACAFGIELGNSDNVNAYADGHRVLVTRGMMNFVKSDEELAYVLAKEMAHNALAHPARQRMSATIGGIIDNLTRMHPDMSAMAGLSGAKPMPQQLDVVADRLSLYMLARAGYNLERVLPFWKGMAEQYPPAVLNAYTALHPATEQRLAAMEKTLADIRTKQARKRPLVP